MTKGSSILVVAMLVLVLVGSAEPIQAQSNREDLALEGGGVLAGGYSWASTNGGVVYYGAELATMANQVTPTQGNVGDDSLPVTILNVAPSVNAGPDQHAPPGEPITFSGSFTDPDLYDTHTIEWDLGDGTIIEDTLTLSHTYQVPSVYTVTLTVTDDGGGVGTDTAIITIEEPRIYLPIVVRNHRTWDAYFEENDHCPTAYGPLASGQAYLAYPDDRDDYYFFELSSTSIVNISVQDFAPTSAHGDLVLLGPASGDECGEYITHYGQPDHSSMVLDPQTLEPGKYHIRVYVADSNYYSTSQLYTLTLRITMPLPGVPTLYAIDNPGGLRTYTVSWSSAAHAEDYGLEEATDSAFSDADQIYVGTSTSYTASGRMTGRYYYRVKARNTWGESGWSEVRLADVLWEVEPNDQGGQANGPIVSGLTYYGVLPGTDDETDYFYFDLPAPHRVQLWLTNIPAGRNYDLVLRSQDLTPVAYSSLGGNADEYIDVSSLPAGLYYVQVYRTSEEGSSQPYHLRVVYK